MGLTHEMSRALKAPGGFIPAFATIPTWCAISGMGRRVTYHELGNGNLRAIKVGSRTLIDVEHGLAWLRTRPAAKISPPPSSRALEDVQM